MNRVFACILLLGASGLATARPIVIEESATLANPDPAFYNSFGRQVAISGDYALALGWNDAYEDDVQIRVYAALLYRRVSGRWQFQQVLRSRTRDLDSLEPSLFAMKGNLAAVELDGNTEAFRLGATGWQPAGTVGYQTSDIEIDGEKIILSTGCSWSAYAAEPDGAGGWTRTYLQGPENTCDDEDWGGPVDIDGNRVIIGNGYAPHDDQEVTIWQRSAPAAWNHVNSIFAPLFQHLFDGEVALRGDDFIVDSRSGGPYVYRYPNLQQATSRLQAPDVYLQYRVPSWHNSRLEKSGDLVFVRELSFDRAGPVINVYRANSAAPGTYQHVAVLTPSAGGPLINSFDVSGNTVLASGAETAYLFELPASFTNRTPKQDNFEAGSTASWTTIAGSQFSVVAKGSNHVYRQSSTTGEARAILGDTNWTNQAIEAEVRPTGWDGNNRFVGLVTRYQNPQNYFYVAMRSSGSVELKRMREGAFVTLASTAFPVTLNRHYRLRLESIGSVHRVYVDGVLRLEADDAGAPHNGNAGLTMNRARADFDNVVVTPSPLTTVYVDDFATPEDSYRWTLTGVGQWAATNGTYTQSVANGEARSVIGGPTRDQVVEARVRQTAWSSAGTAERWAGVLARYKDDGNYYYLHLRSGGTVSLRKLVNGTIVTLASAPLAVSLNTQYKLRLEVVGSRLRGYVNGNLLLQTSDNSHTSGIGGVMTNKAAAQFDNYFAYQP